MRRRNLFWRRVWVGVSGFVSLPVAAAEQMADVGLDINIDYSNDPFYTQMWFFILVASLFLFLLILLVRSERRSVHKKKARKALRKSMQSESPIKPTESVRSMEQMPATEALPSTAPGSLEESIHMEETIHAEKPIHTEKTVELEEPRLAGKKLKMSEELV